MKYYYRDIRKDDLTEWEKLAKNEFLAEDFCSADYLLKGWDDTKGYVLYTENFEWVGCCFNSWGSHKSKLLYNPDGVVFLEACVFPNFRGKGFGKYLIKINFHHSIGYRKNVCINPDNGASVRLCTKYGFKEAGYHKSWKVFVCDDVYPPELKNLELLYVKG